MKLFHYSCDHSLEGIRDLGHALRPWGVPGLPQLVWLTDLDQPDRDGLGLTARVLDCDRTRWRYAVTLPYELEAHIVSWADARRAFRPTYVEMLEKSPGARPEHWYVSRTCVGVDPDPKDMAA